MTTSRLPYCVNVADQQRTAATSPDGSGNCVSLATPTRGVNPTTNPATATLQPHHHQPLRPRRNRAAIHPPGRSCSAPFVSQVVEERNAKNAGRRDDRHVQSLTPFPAP